MDKSKYILRLDTEPVSDKVTISFEAFPDTLRDILWVEFDGGRVYNTAYTHPKGTLKIRTILKKEQRYE